MKKLLKIASSEYRRRVTRKGFIAILLMPLILIAVIAVIGYISASATINSDRGVVGYVDPSNILAQAVQPQPDALNTFQRFADEQAAQTALTDKQIIAYFVLAPDFASSGKADLFYWQNEPGNSVKQAFNRFAKTALVDGHDAAITQRLLDGTNFTLRTPDGSRTYSDNDIFTIIFPIIVSILFIIALFGGAQYLLQAVVDEKENRTMEIIITSVTPMELMSGKIVGLAAVALTQIGVWLLGGVVALGFIKDKVDFLQSARIDPWFIVLALVLCVLQYLFYGAIMAGIGSIVTDAKQGQSYATPFTMVSMIPMFFLAVILIDPNGVLSVILSLFPLTAPLTLLMRYGMTNVPLWQILTAIALLALSTVGAMWLAGRIFRIGMLRFGQRVNISEIAAAIRF
jgi:ABC-2 type transport system permease protein